MNNLIAFQTILRNETVRLLRIWIQTILPPVITTALYFVIFGNLIGPRIGPMAGFDYVQFIAPGLILMSIITNAYANVVSSFFTAKFQKSVEELLISPVPATLILFGYVFGGIVRGLLVGFGVTLVAMFFTELPIKHLTTTLSIAFLSALLFSLIGFTNALFAKRFDDITLIPTFILTPLTYLGGVFYTIELLPTLWQKVSLLNPILHMVHGFRASILGTESLQMPLVFLVIISLCVVMTSLNLYLLRIGFRLRE